MNETISDVFKRMTDPGRLLLPIIRITGHPRAVARFLTGLRQGRPGIDEQFRIIVNFSGFLPKHRLMVEGIGPDMGLVTCKPTFKKSRTLPAQSRLYKQRKRRA